VDYKYLQFDGTDVKYKLIRGKASPDRLYYTELYTGFLKFNSKYNRLKKIIRKLDSALNTYLH